MGTETPNSFMPEPQIEGRRTPSWDYGMMKAVGVRIKTLSQLLPWPTLRKYTLLPQLTASWRSPMSFPLR